MAIHGVDSQGRPDTNIIGSQTSPPEDDGPENIVILPEKPEYHPEPVPVVIVSDPSPPTRKGLRVGRSSVTNSVRALVGEEPQRDSVTIFNFGPDVVFVSPDSILTPYTGWPIPSGGQWSPDTTGPIYAICNDGEAADVAISTGFTQEL